MRTFVRRNYLRLQEVKKLTSKNIHGSKKRLPVIVRECEVVLKRTEIPVSIDANNRPNHNALVEFYESDDCTTVINQDSD